jgi:hypothetical protein
MTFAYSMSLEPTNLICRIHSMDILASLNQFLSHVYDDLACDEDPHFHCLEPT